MHFSVEKSGKEVGSAQRFSHLKCIEFITYSQTTAATPAPPIATLAPYLFPGETFPMPSRCCFDPPPFSTFYIVNKARNQAMMERDIEYHFPLPFTDFASNRVLSPLVTDLSFDQYTRLRVVVPRVEKNFWKFKLFVVIVRIDIFLKM